MSDYIIKKTNGHSHRVSLGEINDPSNIYSRESLLKGQESGELKVFCGCSLSEPIQMTVTKHRGCPHIQTHTQSDRYRHFIYCRHHIDNSGDKPSLYKGAISVDEATGDTLYSVDLDVGFPKHNEERFLKLNRQFFTNHNQMRYERKMTFSSFIKNINTSYFSTFQRNTERSFEKYLDCLYGVVLNAKLYTQKYSPQKFRDYLAANDLRYVQKPIKGIEPFIKKDGSESTFLKKIIFTDDSNTVISSSLLNSAIEDFMKDYNGLSIMSVVNNDRYKILCCYIAPSKGDYSQYFQSGCNCCLILTNKFGLYSESILEAGFYNTLMDALVKPTVRSRYIMRKPLYPENTYAGHPEFIADAILEHRRTSKEIVCECFGTSSSREGYYERKEEKLRTCSYAHIFYDPVDKINLPGVYGSLEECSIGLTQLLDDD